MTLKRRHKNGTSLETERSNDITKTSLFKYTEHLITKNEKFKNKKF